MRIALYTDTYKPHPNGVAIAVLRQYEAISRAGLSVDVYGPSSLKVPNPISSIKMLSTIDSTYALYLPTRLPTLLPSSRAHPLLIHVHTPFSFGMLGLLESKRHRLKSIYTHHTNFFYTYLHYLGWFNRPSVGRLLLRCYCHFLSRFDLVIAPSQSAKEYLRETIAVPARKIVVLPSPSFPGPVEQARESEEEDIDILYITRLAPEKNVQLGIDALITISELSPGLRVAVVGDGVQRHQLWNAVRQRIGVHFTFYGVVPHCDVFRLLRKAKLLLFTSLSDTQGLVIDKAHTCGVPVVAVDCPLARERVTHERNGWISPGTPGSIAAVLATALDKLNNEPAIIRQFCRSAVVDKSSERWVDSYLAIIRRLYE